MFPIFLHSAHREPKVCWKRPLDLLSSQAPVRRPNLKPCRPSWRHFQRSSHHLPQSRPRPLEDASRPTPLTNITPTTDPRQNRPLITPTTPPTKPPTPLQDLITATVQDGKTPRTETQNSVLCAKQSDLQHPVMVHVNAFLGLFEFVLMRLIDSSSFCCDFKQTGMIFRERPPGL